jgi:hypothetical protein
MPQTAAATAKRQIAAAAHKPRVGGGTKAARIGEPVAEQVAEQVAASKPVRRRANPRRATVPVESTVPKQGYEPEEELELGHTVNPPSGTEIVESVAEIFSELAGSGFAAGGRILKDAFSLLRRP